MRILLAAAVALTWVGCGAGCGESSPTVILYVSADEHVARQIVHRFEQQTGHTVGLVTDSEASKTTGLVERLRAERDNPQADVFWSSEIFMTMALADEGVLEPHRTPAGDAWPEEHRDAEQRWYAFAARPRVIVYAPDRVRVDDVPETWMALTEPRWKDRIVMADPRFGTTGGHLGAMKAFWDRWVAPPFYEAWLIGLAENGVRLLPGGNAGVVGAVVDGDADLGLTDADDVWAAKAQGYNVHLVYPRHDVAKGLPGKGTLLIPNTVARVRGGKNAAAAALLVDFLISEEVERMLAESDSHNIPLRPGLADEYPEHQVPRPLRIDFKAAAAARQRAIDLAMKHLRDGKPSG